MTVAELIDKLKAFPVDHVVAVEAWSDFGRMEYGPPDIEAGWVNSDGDRVGKDDPRVAGPAIFIR